MSFEKYPKMFAMIPVRENGTKPRASGGCQRGKSRG
jgi:hypothetical protein